MDWFALSGIGLLFIGFIGYIVGVYMNYPGRTFSITAIIVGITVVAIAQGTATKKDT